MNLYFVNRSFANCISPTECLPSPTSLIIGGLGHEMKKELGSDL